MPFCADQAWVSATPRWGIGLNTPGHEASFVSVSNDRQIGTGDRPFARHPARFPSSEIRPRRVHAGWSKVEENFQCSSGSRMALCSDRISFFQFRLPILLLSFLASCRDPTRGPSPVFGPACSVFFALYAMIGTYFNQWRDLRIFLGDL